MAYQRIPWKRLEKDARTRFGVRRFRPGQKELIEAVLKGHDALGILPTGGGKSLCFQLPSLYLDGITVVVSPLLALMRDQKEKLADLGVDAAKLDSTLTASEERAALEEIRNGRSSLVYVTPERFENPEYLAMLKARGVALLVVDEAHCVSQWGHDFRPAYLSIRDCAKKLGRPPILALTATATGEVVKDISGALGLRSPEMVRLEIARENLVLEVARTVNLAAKQARALDVIRGGGSGVIYVSTVRQAEEVWQWLLSQGIRAGLYHARRSHGERIATQESFMSDETPVIVATKAFGLGVDKPNIRFVVHFNFPDSLESYYQEAGRAGRDGKDARAVLLYRLEDRRVQTYFLGGKYPRREDSLRVYEIFRALSEATGELAAADLVRAAGIPEKKTKVVVAQLASMGLLTRGAVLRKKRKYLEPAELEEFLGEHESRHLTDRERLETMMSYGQTTRCRVEFIREYFGERPERSCGRCDNCVNPWPTAQAA